MKCVFRLKGGPKSGHRRHRGIPGHRGGSLPGTGISRTVDVAIGGRDVPIDRGIASAVKAFNAAGLETGHSCAGHVCGDPIGTQLSFRHVVRSESVIDKLKAKVNSGDLELDWTLTDKLMNWHELYVTEGFYGGRTMPSTKKNISLAHRDLAEMVAVIE